MRPAGTRGEEEIAPRTAAPTAHTISILPTLNAKMRPRAATAERISEPGAQNQTQDDQHLTKAIREAPRTLTLRRSTIRQTGGKEGGESNLLGLYCVIPLPFDDRLAVQWEQIGPAQDFW